MTFSSTSGIKLIDQLGKCVLLADNMTDKLNDLMDSRDSYLSNKEEFETSLDNLSAIVSTSLSTTSDFIIDCCNLIHTCKASFDVKAVRLKELDICDDQMNINPNVLHALPLSTDKTAVQLFSSMEGKSDDTPYWVDISIYPENFNILDKWNQIITSSTNTQKVASSLGIFQDYIDAGSKQLPALSVMIENYRKLSKVYGDQVLAAIRDIREATLGDDVVPKIYSSDPELALSSIKSDVNLTVSQMTMWFSQNDAFITSLFKAMVGFASNMTIACNVLNVVSTTNSYVAESTIDRTDIEF